VIQSNTSTEAALWNERNDLDPFMAEYYATNAQHELDRALTVSPLDQLRIAHVHRLLGDYHGLAALAQLHDNSDFEDANVTKTEEIVACGDTAFVHPVRAALMGADGDGNMALSSSSHSRSRFASHRNAATGDEGSRSRSRESSVESISRDNSLGRHVHEQRQHVNHDLGHTMH
jgi:hypothetical protein